MTKEILDMADKCQLASNLTAYIWGCVLTNDNNPENKLEFVDKNGDIRYTEDAQDIFCKVLDIVDNTLEGESDE